MISFGNAASSHIGLIPLKTAYKKRGESLRAIAKPRFQSLSLGSWLMQMNYCVIRRVDLWRGLYNVVSNAIQRVFCIAPGWSVMNRCWKDNSSIGSKSCLRRETGAESPILRYPSFPHPLTAIRFNQITGISSLSPLPHTLEPRFHD